MNQQDRRDQLRPLLPADVALAERGANPHGGRRKVPRRRGGRHGLVSHRREHHPGPVEGDHALQ